ncbi:MAG: hypothetical protein ACTS8P_03150 [Arsenophonus sp. NC-XBC3-MAG3]
MLKEASQRQKSMLQELIATALSEACKNLEELSIMVGICEV